MATNVIALGGNAILDKDPTDTGQKKVVKTVAKSIADFIERGEKVVICHGNGPQVGNLLNQQRAGESDINPAFGLDTCVAMTQGSIGYWLQNALKNELQQRNNPSSVVATVSQVLVDKEDPAFKNPSKPVGSFYSKEEAVLERKKSKTSAVFKEDAGRGYRRVVPSPYPMKIIENAAIKSLVADGIIPICSGGGGIPVIYDRGVYQGIEAVIDKDFSAMMLAKNIKADRLIILTNVTNVYINYNTPQQKALEAVTASELKTYIAQNQFAAGSMLPKIQAAIDFVYESTKTAVITSFDQLPYIQQGVGTVVTDG
ncbi:carbamate kinase [Streptococcus dentasini]